MDDSLITSVANGRRKLLLLHTHLHIHYLQPLHINPTRQIWRGQDRSIIPHQTQIHATFQFVLHHLGAVVKGAVYSIPHKGGRTLGAFIFKIGFSTLVVHRTLLICWQALQLEVWQRFWPLIQACHPLIRQKG